MLKLELVLQHPSLTLIYWFCFSSARDANQFTVSVNIEPSSKVTFNLTYEQLLTRRQGVYEHTVHINPGAIVPQLRVRTNIFEILPISDIKVLPFENDIGNEFSNLLSFSLL